MALHLVLVAGETTPGIARCRVVEGDGANQRQRAATAACAVGGRSNRAVRPDGDIGVRVGTRRNRGSSDRSRAIKRRAVAGSGHAGAARRNGRWLVALERQRGG